jgi:ribose transport system ATP-binding protein
MACNVSVPGLLDHIELSVRRGEILGLFGLMGAGRTELLRTIFGLEPGRCGIVRMKDCQLDRSPKAAIRAGMAYVTESRRDDGLLLDASTRDNLSLVHLGKFQRRGVIDSNSINAMAEKMVGEMQVRGHGVVERRVGDLSGGNQQKVVIGKWLLGEPELLLLDEPSRGIDVAARFDIYSRITQLAGNGTSVIVASSELEELEGLCHRIIVLNRGRIAAEFAAGAYDKQAILSAAFGEAH